MDLGFVFLFSFFQQIPAKCRTDSVSGVLIDFLRIDPPDVVGFEYGGIHCLFLKSSSFNFACLKIERKVPCGTSLAWMGTITVKTERSFLRYLACEPDWETKKNPRLSRTLIISFAEYGLDMLQSDRGDGWSAHPLRFFRNQRVPKIQIQSISKHCQSFLLAFAKTGYFHVQTLSNIMSSLFPNNGF